MSDRCETCGIETPGSPFKNCPRHDLSNTGVPRPVVHSVSTPPAPPGLEALERKLHFYTIAVESHVRQPEIVHLRGHAENYRLDVLRVAEAALQQAKRDERARIVKGLKAKREAVSMGAVASAFGSLDVPLYNLYSWAITAIETLEDTP